MQFIFVKYGSKQKCMEPLLFYLFCERESFLMRFWHLWSMATLMSCLSNLNGFLALREVGGWRGLTWRRGIGDFIHHLHIPIFEKGGEERKGALEFSWGFGAASVEELFLFGVFGVWQLEELFFFGGFGVWQLEEHSHGHFGEGAPFLHHWLVFKACISLICWL